MISFNRACKERILSQFSTVSRVTPYFEGDNLVASGVQMEAYSVEDQGEAICFNVYVYNVQPGIKINYANGSSKAVSGEGKEINTYILNTNTKNSIPHHARMPKL